MRPWKGRSSTGRKASSFTRLSAMKERKPFASAGSSLAISASIRARSGVASSVTGLRPSNTRRYCGSRRMSSTSSSRSAPQEAKISRRMRG